MFGGLSQEDEARVALDRALYEWLDSQRKSGVPKLDRLPLERWVRKVSEAFEIIGLLKLRGCSSKLRQSLPVWNSWVDRLAISEFRDGRYVFWRTLALTQRLVAGTDTAMNPLALEPFWLRVCEHSGTTFPAYYLDVGLLGLRLLPESDGAPLERPWTAGLACWATGQEPSIERFSQQWWTLKGLYPRMPAYWRRVVDETLKKSLAKRFPEELKEWWRQDVQARDDAAKQQPGKRPAGVPRLAPLEEVKSLHGKAGDPLPSIKRKMETLIDERRHYAEMTGDSHFLVTTACNIGMAVIKGADDPVGRGQFAVQLARQALSWQPTDPFAWSLWRDALANQGAFEAAEHVGWEAIWRFPENAQWRTQLALLLAGRPGRETDAEQLLRETIDRFPDNVVARTQLALLLAGLPGRENDADQLLRETIDRFSDDVFARNQLAELLITVERTVEASGVVDDIFSRHLEDEASFDLRARLLYHSDDIEAARQALMAGIKRLQTHPVLEVHLRKLDKGEELPLKSVASRLRNTAAKATGSTDVDTDEAVYMGGRLRRIHQDARHRQGDDQWHGEAIEEVRRVLSEDPNFAYAEYLSRELEGWDAEGSAGEPFAIAFVDAMKRKDADRFSRLEESDAGQTRLVDVAKVFLFEDRAAADRTLAWLGREARSEPRMVSALRGFLCQRFDISSVVSGDDFVKKVADNDNIETDLIESAFAGGELQLAA